MATITAPQIKTTPSGDGHKASAKRILSRLIAAGLSPELHPKVAEIVNDELRGLYHGSLVVFDGGSSLADHGLVKIVDEEGTPFVRHLHEIGFEVYDRRA